MVRKLTILSPATGEYNIFFESTTCIGQKYFQSIAHYSPPFGESVTKSFHNNKEEKLWWWG